MMMKLFSGQRAKYKHRSASVGQLIEVSLKMGKNGKSKFLAVFANATLDPSQQRNVLQEFMTVLR